MIFFLTALTTSFSILKGSASSRGLPPDDFAEFFEPRGDSRAAFKTYLRLDRFDLDDFDFGRQRVEALQDHQHIIEADDARNRFGHAILHFAFDQVRESPGVGRQRTRLAPALRRRKKDHALVFARRVLKPVQHGDGAVAQVLEINAFRPVLSLQMLKHHLPERQVFQVGMADASDQDFHRRFSIAREPDAAGSVAAIRARRRSTGIRAAASRDFNSSVWTKTYRRTNRDSTCARAMWPPAS